MARVHKAWTEKLPVVDVYTASGFDTLSGAILTRQINNGWVSGYQARSTDPLYARLIQSGQDASGNFQKTILRQTGPCAVRFTEKWNAYTGHERQVTGFIKAASAGPPELTAPVFKRTTPDDIALKRLKQKIAEQLPKRMQSIAPLAESRELFPLLRQLLGHGATLVTSLMSLRVRALRLSPAQISDELARIWLAFSFAVKPLLSDMETFKEVFSEDDSSYNGKKFTVYGSAKENYQVRELRSVGVAGTNHTSSVVHQWQLTYSVRYTAGYSIKRVNRSTFEAFGLTFSDVVPSAWELIPFSWLVDYFTTIGEWLQDVAVMHAPPALYLNVTRKLEGKTVPTSYTYSSNQTGILSIRYTQVPGFYECFRIHREVLSPSTLPGRRLRVKTFSEIAGPVNDLSKAINRLLNLVSILETGRGR